jgi:two-component system response regulator FixJ
MDKPIVHVIDDDETVRTWLDHMVSSSELEVRTHADPRAFLEGFQPERPCLLVVDLRMPGMGGLELHDELRARGIRVPVIIITAHGDVPAAVRAFRSGVSDFLEKPFDKEVLLERIRVLLDEDRSARQTRLEIVETQRKLDLLTKREREVLEYVISGKPNKLIAQQLGVTIKAIEAHRARIMDKMAFASVQELVQAITVSRQWKEC